MEKDQIIKEVLKQLEGSSVNVQEAVAQAICNIQHEKNKEDLRAKKLEYQKQLQAKQVRLRRYELEVDVNNAEVEVERLEGLEKIKATLNDYIAETNVIKANTSKQTLEEIVKCKKEIAEIACKIEEIEDEVDSVCNCKPCECSCH